MKALVTGATGLVGGSLLRRLSGAHVLSRSPGEAERRFQGRARAFAWAGDGSLPPAEAFAGVDAVVHLAGESVADGRWDPERKRRIRESRVLSTRALVSAFEQQERRPAVFVCASGVGYYGDRADEVLTEDSAPGGDFLASVCVEWEREARRAETLGIRVVRLRIGMVLSPEGGALGKMLLPFRLGVGGQLGTGRQWTSWIHLDDLVGLILHAMATDALRGPVNAVAPGAVTNAQFTKELGRALGRPALLPVPGLGLRVALGEMSEVVLASQHAVPAAALASGYQFRFSDLGLAFRDLLGR